MAVAICKLDGVLLRRRPSQRPENAVDEQPAEGGHAEIVDVAESHTQAGGAQIGAGDLPRRLALAAEAAAFARPPDETIVLTEFMASIERELIERALVRSKANRSQAARLLGISRPRLLRRLEQLGLEAGIEDGETDKVELELDVEDEGDPAR